MVYWPSMSTGGVYGPKPYKFTGFGDIYGPKLYKFIRFGYKFAGFGMIISEGSRRGLLAKWFLGGLGYQGQQNTINL